MLGQEWRPNAYAAFESCRGHVGPTLGLCWYVPVGSLTFIYSMSAFIYFADPGTKKIMEMIPEPGFLGNS